MPVSDAQYAAFIDLVIVCREAEDKAKAETKALYAEIAEAGEDKTAIGLLVRELRLSNKDRVKAEIRDAAVEDGRIRYRRGKASHVRAREAGADPVTGEFTEAALPPPAGADAQPSAVQEVVPSPSFAEIQPETAAQTVADHRDTTSLPEREAVESSGADLNGLAGPACAADEQPANIKPAHNSLGSAADAAGGVTAPAVTRTKLKMNAEFFHEPHPMCQPPGFCGGNSNLGLCPDCRGEAEPDRHVDAEERRLH